MSRRLFFVLLCCVLILPSIATAQYTHPSSLVAYQGDGLSTDVEALLQAEVPPRDRVSLSQRFLGVGEVPPPPTDPVRTYQVGDTEQFSVQNTDSGAFTITAEMIYTNDHVYMWVEEGYTLDLAAVQSSADLFSEEVYEQTRDVFGSEATPGADGDPKLHILHSSRLGGGVAAYYYSESQYPREAVSTSNQREMFYVNLDNMRPYIGTDYYVGILAHEFQHMIHWAIDANEESWLNEGLAELASYLTGFGESPFASSYLRDTHVQLVYWPPNDRGLIYGGSFLFTAYLYEQYGIEAVRALVASPANGMASVQAALDAVGAVDPLSGDPMTAELAFANFTIANYLKNSALAEGHYGYADPVLNDNLPRADADGNYTNPDAFILNDRALNQWSAQYFRIQRGSAEGTYTLDFSGNTTVGLLPISAHGGKFAYWSNRVDNSDTRLTREFDLSGVTSATLEFWTWYDIEENWDYAYVAVSTDDGATWDTLASNRTTTDNPHNTSYGNGYTGRSGDWVQESIDLSAYAGQTVLVRFEYVTDDATIENGMLIDDISIPELGYTEDFEAESDWNAEGWVRIQNVVDQDFSIHVVEIKADGTTTVTRLLDPEDANVGQWQLNFSQDLSEIVVIVSAFAPITTESATIDIMLAPTE